MKIKGLDKLNRKLASMERKGARRALRAATRAGTAVLGKAAKAAVPVDEGVLKKAQATKVSGKGLSMDGRAGADMDKLASDESRPSNLDHLVEFGHVAPDGTFVPPSGAMRKAEAQAMPKAEATFIAKLKAGIERELA